MHHCVTSTPINTSMSNDSRSIKPPSSHAIWRFIRRWRRSFGGRLFWVFGLRDYRYKALHTSRFAAAFSLTPVILNALAAFMAFQSLKLNRDTADRVDPLVRRASRPWICRWLRRGSSLCAALEPRAWRFDELSLCAVELAPGEAYQFDPAVLLRSEELRLINELNELAGLQPSGDDTTPLQYRGSAPRLTAAGYKVRSSLESAEPADRTENTGTRVRAAAEDLGTLTAPLMP